MGKNQDPRSGAFLTPGSGIAKIKIRIRDENPGSYFHIYGLKIYKIFDADLDPGSF
jgi:hypothetical protein